ncbi:TPA: DMT family transporter [Staphylococcus pseudintermedius]|uniref:DMT family transporter n=2 Tax=Staphylococcus pseudintermedius TaxID=283734 RepID=UPI003860EFFF
MTDISFLEPGLYLSVIHLEDDEIILYVHYDSGMLYSNTGTDSGVAVKIQGESVSLEVALLYRSIIALVLFSVLLWGLRQRVALNNVNWLTVVGFGLCNFTGSYLLLYYGTFYSTAAIVTLIFSMKSILTPVLISIVFKKSIAPKIYIGGLLGILSVMVILSPDLNHLSSEFIMGIVMAIFGTIITFVGGCLVVVQ